MSTCISMHGEYSDHTINDDFICTRCDVLDEDALIEDRNKWRALAHAVQQPNRDAVIDALVMTRLSDHAGTDMQLIEQASDAVLAALAVPATPGEFGTAI